MKLLSQKVKKKDTKQWAGAVVYREAPRGDHEVLLISSRKYLGSWVFPVGRVKATETLEETAARECAEESGYLIDVGEKLGVISLRKDTEIRLFTFFISKVRGKETSWEKDRTAIWVSVKGLSRYVPDVFKQVTQWTVAKLI